MTKLRWDRNFIVGRSWYIQTEHVRGEGVLYALEGLSFDESQILATSDIETAFHGRGGKGKVKASAQRLADLIEREREFSRRLESNDMTEAELVRRWGT